MAGDAVEQEIKLGAWPGFTLPDLTGVAPGITVAEEPTLELDAVYVDTTDLRLVRRGVSLRRRTGEGATRWTLKLPADTDSGIVLSRREFDVETDATEVPDELSELIVGWVRRTPLVPVTTIRTTRRRHLLRADDGVPLVELADDEVSVIEADEHVAARFREVEAELLPGASPDLLTLVAAALEAAGAGAPDRTTKVVRALGPRALAPPDLATDDVEEGASVAEVLVTALTASARQVVDHDHVVRLDDDLEGVHKARVGTRRLRSDLKAFAPSFDEPWATDLRGELKWWAQQLGHVRDTDVLLERLWDAVEALPDDDRPSGALVVERLAAERRHQVAALHTAMRSERYLELLERLVDAVAHPCLAKEARRPAVEVLPARVRRRWKALRKAVRDLGDHPTDDALHAVRILAKRARYATDTVAPVVGDDARRLSEALADLQDELGELHDTAVAIAWLRGQTNELTHHQAMVSGQLIAGQRQRAGELRSSWSATWEACQAVDRSWLG
jgi:CHAD domain-containing protein